MEEILKYLAKLFLIFFIISGCGLSCSDNYNEPDTFHKEDFIEHWWLVVEAPNKYEDYENQYCFYADDDNNFYFMDYDSSWYYQMPYTQIDVNKFDIEELFVATVNIIPETPKEDWQITVQEFLIQGEIIAEECPQLTIPF